MMAFTSDIYAVMTQVSNVLKTVYSHYFQSEMNAIKNTKNHKDLKNESLDCCLQFLKDFELCPYVVNRKLAFYIWHSI
jgi:hypothetical protein